MEAILSLGSNLGDRLANLIRARDALCQLPETRLLKCSRVYETAPMDPPATGDNPDYLNAIVIVESALEVRAFSTAMHEIETRLGRTRQTERNAPRTIDIDLIACGNCVLDDSHLQLPHPRATERRFVCEPLAEVRPDLILPGQKQTIREILLAIPRIPRVGIAMQQW